MSSENSTTASYEMHWKAGTDPTKGRWPGYHKDEVSEFEHMRITKDVGVKLRDGVTVFVDIYQPAEFQGKLPILLTWNPYGKHGLKTFAMFPNSGVPPDSVSRFAAWEGPDPLYWTERGYAVINGDTRGAWGSEGDLEIFSQQEAEDGYDVIEWAAALPWSNGRVGTAGVSYLAIVQWRLAEQNPPHLACINPWEGFTDLYRDYSYHGGIPETNFVKFMEWSCEHSFNRVEDWVKMHEQHTLRDEYFASKSCHDLAKIKVPAYVVADWGDQGLHTRGAIEGFASISSPNKWLEVHGRKKWQYFYQTSSLLRQEAFYDRFLKGKPSEIDSWPRVRIEVRERAFQGIERGETEWPIARTEVLEMFLDTGSNKLTDKMPATFSSTSYNSTVKDDRQTFHYVFAEDTEVTGTMRLRLWVSTDASNDMDIFVQVDKLDKNSEVVPFVAMAMLDDGPLALGWLRVSHRELDLQRSTTLRPVLKHERRLLLQPNEIVPADIEIWPSSTRFKAGESLLLTVQGNDIFRYDLPQVQLHESSVNAGRHSVYSGPLHQSCLFLPILK